jgi:hypothetical protein
MGHQSVHEGALVIGIGKDARMFDINRLADSQKKAPMMLLNLVSGLALLIAASWFSYNLFSTRDAAQATVQDTHTNSQDIKALERKITRPK